MSMRNPLCSHDRASQLFLNYITDGAATTLDTLIAEHLQGAYCQARRLLNNSSEAEDAVQEALLQLVRTASRFDGSIPFAAWFGRIVHDAAVQALRARARRRHYEKRAGSETARKVPPAGAVENDMHAAAVRAAVCNLPERYRATIDLHYFAGLSQRDTAKALGTNENAIGVRLHRARECLRALLQRRGITVGSGLIALALAEAPVHAVPASLVAASSASTLLASVTAGASGSYSPPLLIGGKTVMSSWLGIGIINVLVAGAIVGLYAISSVSPRASEPAAAVATKSAQMIPPTALVVKKLDFNTPDQAKEFSFKKEERSTWHWRPDGGQNDSGCMEMDGEELLVDLRTPELKLPALITLKAFIDKSEVIDNHVVIAGLSGTWTAIYRNLGKPVFADRDKSKWVEYRTYVTEEFTYVSCDGRLNAFNAHQLCARNSEERRWLTFGCRGRQRIDEVEIHEIDAAGLPDVGNYLDALARIPASRRFGRVVLPDLRSVTRGQPVFVDIAGTMVSGTEPLARENPRPKTESIP